MTPLEITALAVGMFAGSFVQSVVGFGGGMVSVPVMLWGGLTLPEAVAANLGLVLVQTLWGTFHSRAHLEWRSTLPMFVPRLLFVPVGVAVLARLSVMGPQQIKQVVGVIVAVIVTVHVLFGVKPRAHLARIWLWIAGSCSGFLAGVVGMGGPPLVLWVMAHDWPPEKARAFLWLSFMQIMPVMTALLIWKFGAHAAVALGTGLLFTPLAILGARLGMSVGGRMDARKLRFAAYALLMLTALTSVFAPF